MKRITRDEMLMEIAEIVALRSTCERKKVGAVIALEGRVLSIGYAGAPAGFPHCSPKICDLTQPCERTIHAEANAIAFAAKTGVAIAGATLYTTCSPCINCAKLCINTGIQRVVFGQAYRDVYPLEMLTKAGITWELRGHAP